MIKASDLTDKEVVSISDGRKIGMITDLEVDLEKGRINAIIIPDSKGLKGLFSREIEYEIMWNQIKKIGEDVILIEIRDREEATKPINLNNDIKNR